MQFNLSCVVFILVTAFMVEGTLDSRVFSHDCNPFIPVPSKNPCEMCRCIRGAVNCKKRPCPLKPVDTCIAFVKPGECCFDYLCGNDRLKCDPNRIVHVKSSHPCEVCRCKKGRVKCDWIACEAAPSKNCFKKESEEKKCCPEYICDDMYPSTDRSTIFPEKELELTTQSTTEETTVVEQTDSWQSNNDINPDYYKEESLNEEDLETSFVPTEE